MTITNRLKQPQKYVNCLSYALRMSPNDKMHATRLKGKLQTACQLPNISDPDISQILKNTMDMFQFDGYKVLGKDVSALRDSSVADFIAKKNVIGVGMDKKDGFLHFYVVHDLSGNGYGVAGFVDAEKNIVLPCKLNGNTIQQSAATTDIKMPEDLQKYNPSAETYDLVGFFVLAS